MAAAGGREGRGRLADEERAAWLRGAAATAGVPPLPPVPAATVERPAAGPLALAWSAGQDASLEDALGVAIGVTAAAEATAAAG